MTPLIFSASDDTHFSIKQLTYVYVWVDDFLDILVFVTIFGQNFQKVENIENLKFETKNFDGLGTHLLGHLVQKDLFDPKLLQKNMGHHMTVYMY